MVGDSMISQFQSLNVWKKRAERAPHKPLLVLLALGRVQAGHPRMAPFTILEPLLRELLRDFGPPRTSYRPEYPFWRLQRDGLWQVSGDTALIRRTSNNDPLLSELRRAEIVGGFPEKIYLLLRKRPELIREIGLRLLESHFPSSLHEAISSVIGLDLGVVGRSESRDGRFRNEVINAWQHQCAFCGYNVRFDHTDLGLEAAHIMWVQAGGAELIDNGICCCVLHHQAFGRGAISINNELRVIVSSRLHGGQSLPQWFTDLNGQKLKGPVLKIAVPRIKYLQWHQCEVFKGPRID